MKLNNSDGLPNFSQRNNEFYFEKKGPKGTSVMKAAYMCNVTSLCMAATYNGIPEEKMPKGRFSQPEDNLCEFICTNKEVLDYYAKVNKAWYDQWESGDPSSYNPNEVHAVLAFGFNKWIGKNVDKFFENLDLRSYISFLYNGLSMPTSMTFGKLGHIICVVGMEYEGCEKIIENYINGYTNNFPSDMKIIFDDPYGRCTNFDTGVYTTESGNDRVMTIDQFIKYSKPLNTKNVMCHIMNVK